jgi:hypothetical protein
MERYLRLFAKGVGLGLGIGLCLAGAFALLHRALHPAVPGSGTPVLYFLVVGFVMGIIGGWILSIQMILGNLLASLFMKVAELVPLPAQMVGEEWAKKMETFFKEVLKPFPAFFRKFVEFFLVTRFDDLDRMNRALDKAKKKGQDQGRAHQWALMVILHYVLEPLWFVFFAVYGILLLMSCVLWSFPFFR